MAKLLRLLFPLIFLGIGYLSYSKFSQEEEKPTPIRPERKPIEVRAEMLKVTDYQVVLSSQGVVQPHNETSLTPRVSGRIVAISPQFESGSFFNEGDILIELDPTDFLAAKSGAEARLARAEATLAQEEARAEQALLDWKDLDYQGPPTDLVLRKPQLKEANANVKAATAELEDTRRDLERAMVRAPYAGRVKTRLIGLGQSVSPGTELGEIFSTDFAEVRLSLSARELNHVELPNNPDDPPIPITLTDALADGTLSEPESWEGMIVRTEGVLDEKSRKLFLIARVDDPFGLKKEGTPPLRIGQPIRAVIKGSTIPGVFVIPRLTLNNPNQILTVNPEDSTLVRQRITPIWSDELNLIVRDDLKEGWHLVTNRLASAPNGATVTIVEPDEEPETKTASANPQT